MAREQRRQALILLSQSADLWSHAGPALGSALSDPDSDVRRTACELLLQMRPVLTITDFCAQTLRTAARSSDPVVRKAAISALCFHHVARADDFSTWSNDPDPEVRCETAVALGHYGYLDRLARLAGDSDARVRRTVATVIGRTRMTAGSDLLADLAADQEPTVRAAALSGMARTGVPPVARQLVVVAVRSPWWQVRAAAAEALSADDAAVAIPALSFAAKDDVLEVRRVAVRAIATRFTRFDAGRAALVEALKDGDQEVRAYARHGLSAENSVTRISPQEA